MTTDILPRPTGHEDRTGPEIWVDEAIWGHRLYDDQTPWLTLLEFLCVLQAEHAEGRTLREDGYNSLSYRPQTQMRLRNLIFNNPHITNIEAKNLRDDAAWAEWRQKMAENAGGLDNVDFRYLENVFASFADFAMVVGFLQSSAIEGGSNKRWSSKFVFPFGVNALYEDVAVSPQGNVATDRRFFARTGELLYLMLARSSGVDELRELLRKRLLEENSPYNQLIAALQGEQQTARNDRGGAYLPLKTHPLFDQLAEDWIALLKRPMPFYDALPHLVAVTGLNLSLYQLHRAGEVVSSAPISLVCEIVSPKRSVIRELSANSYQHNSALPQQAVEQHIKSIASTPSWQAAIASEDASYAAAEILKKSFDWPDPDEEEGGGGAPDDLLARLLDKALVRHRQHNAKIHGAWSRAIGLSSRRSSRRIRYAPTDKLLKSLVIARVEKRQEFREFLAVLHTRYGLVIGEQQAVDLIETGRADQEDFSNNARRLEERLASLGLLRRLSDSCAYVENPFTR
jgi:hypothetical protein